ncbi:glycoside hydrolase family 16 protein [Roridomyces roridus]|uniref:Glycoside hydrolase family 16 protein n=1 Tax=Roridomyces roridus TaxID=1738132 RepID=A0AAD7BIB5_9AGAR|nr:glycoside hydrolase family 16 protein [Roridomyces roridus]
MKTTAQLKLVSLASLASLVSAGTYSRTENIIGSGFFNSFNFEAISDPTQGRVNYVDRTTAQAQNLTFASANTFILRADFKTVISDSSPTGRNSVRIRSNNVYTTHAAVFDIAHMPQSCGCGEVDIIEGVNDQGANQITLHTSPGCSMPATRTQTGTSLQLDCNTQVNGNAGCGFWPRNTGNVPANVRAGGTSVNTANWGTPTANFPNTQCNLPQFFSGNNIIINLTFCGQWAGAVYGNSGCPSTCNSFVDQNPSAFNNAYFEFIRAFFTTNKMVEIPSEGIDLVGNGLGFLP